MNTSIEWIVKIEKLASEVYKKSSLLFKNNVELSSFLVQESEEEIWHAQIISEAANQVKNLSIDIQPDDQARLKVEAALKNCLEKIENKTATEADVLECMVTVEFTEWNDFFLYVLNSLKEKSLDFQYISAKMQNHLQRIKQFLSTLPDSKKHIERINKLKPVWETRFLIVDDEYPILEFLKVVLGDKKNVETAANGREGLKKLLQNHFDIIISDIYMPELNGIDFFLKAQALFPTIYERFIFITGYYEKYKDFFKKHRVKYLFKPFSINDITQMINKVLQENIKKKH